MKKAVVRQLLWILALAAAAAQASPQLTVTPGSGLIDAPFRVQVSGVTPGSRVTLSASRPDAKGRTWIAVGEYSADAKGRIDLDVSPSLSGSYTGVSPHGLWCSALPVAPDRLSAYIADLPKHPDIGTTPHLDVSAIYTVLVTASIDGKVVATTTATRAYTTGIKTEEVTAPGRVRGVFFPAAPGTHRGVPVLVLAGSGGGLELDQAALLASHGHPALAQGIFDYRDLPDALLDIPLERFRAGARWLEHRTGVRRVAVMGSSRGSEAAGLAASYFPKDFAAAVLYVPSHLINFGFGPGVKYMDPAWTLAGKPLPPEPWGVPRNAAERAALATNTAAWEAQLRKPPGPAGTPSALDGWNDPEDAVAYGIPYEKMAGPVLVIAAGADEMWPSFISAVRIRQRLAAHGKSALAQIHIYRGAGHMMARVGIGGAMSSFIFHPVAKAFMATGGLPNANCESSYDAWAQVLAFLGKVAPPADGSH